MQKEIVHNTCCTQHDPHYSMHKRTVHVWQWTIWNQTSKILPPLTTQRTKENEGNNLLSLTDQLKAWEEKFQLLFQWESYIHRIPRWPLGYIDLWIFIFRKCPLEFLFSNLHKFGKYEDSSYSSFIYLHKRYSYFLFS